ncbi:hypothetical protein PAXRUDRAFT_16167 [Paxillus rubicundulus Ve08.2h10]|uniref:Spermidine synthase n=1 Tax=Paxillus rubicundulus Ve08.2h10 TaxID=930991 RepID=A0A0D0D7N8_9AGAM|nr:hypothetical protein PAXRUDRAFT_16167 [Paxillus rubicundulus Ve08.2h10]
MPTAEAKAATWISAKASLSIFTISVGISLFTSAYERAVNPLFGSVATEKYLNYVIHGNTALGVILPRLPRPRLVLVLAILIQVASHTSYWISVFAARHGDPVVGPLVAHSMVLAPVIYLAVSLAMSIDSRLATMALAANALQLRPIILFITHQLSLDTHQDTVFLILGSLAFFAWAWQRIDAETSSSRRSSPSAISSAISLTKKLWPLSIPITFILFPVFRSPTLSGARSLPYESSYYPLRILSSKDSVTGVVVVGELLPPKAEEAGSANLHSIRYLRASHSILGGVWTGSKVASVNDFPSRTDQVGTPLGDSIYSAFVLQEAVRLVNSTQQGKDGKWENALVIGLGAGISADGFAQHGISTTVVEIDPAVYDAARQYFGLGHLGDDKVFLEDARGWVHKRQSAMQLDEGRTLSKFELVVHDCFSGGGVPQHLFSVEFWNDLISIMSPEGVVAVNFAGKLGSQSSRAVISTLLKAFGQCRTFHDMLEPMPEEQLHSDFLNMVFFCSPSPAPLMFRPSVDADYLHSYLRHHVLSSLDEREVSITQVRGGVAWSKATEEQFLLTDVDNKLDEWQREEAMEHWKLMRRILPDIVWETY